MATEKKKWFDVEIPAVSTKAKLLAYSIEQLNNRTIKLDLTRQLRGKSIEAVIKIIVKDGKVEGEVQKISLLGFFIRRMMRKSVSYVEDSFSCESEDSILEVKPFLITRKKVTRAVRKALRENCRKYIQEYLREMDTELIFSDIFSSKLQKSLSLKLRKIYPLALCEIRVLRILKRKEGVAVEKIRDSKKKTKREEMLEKLEAENPKQEKSQIEEIEEELAKKEAEQEKTEEKIESKEEEKE